LVVFYLGIFGIGEGILAEVDENATAGRGSNSTTKDPVALLSLRDVIELALKNNTSLKQENLRKKLEKHSLNIQRAKFLPTIDASGVYKRGRKKNIEDIKYDEDYSSTSTGINLNYNLFNSGIDILTFNYKKHNLKVQEYTEENKSQSVTYEAVVKYYNILLLEANKNVAQESENSYLEILKSIEASHDVGIASSIDRLQAENSYQSSRLDFMEADNKLRDGYADLNVFLGREPNSAIDLEKSKMAVKKEAIDVDEYVRLALINRPDLKKARELRKQAEDGLTLAKMNLYPSVGVDFDTSLAKMKTSYSRKYSERMDDSGGGSGLVADAHVTAFVKIPVFAGLSTLNAIGLKRKELEIISLQLEELERGVAKDVLVACRDFEHDQAAFFLSKDLLETKTNETRMILEMYSKGSKSLADVTKVQADLEKTKLSFIKFKHNWLTRRIHLLKLIGMINLESIINISEF
jgi:outer membrane protein